MENPDIFKSSPEFRKKKKCRLRVEQAQDSDSSTSFTAKMLTSKRHKSKDSDVDSAVSISPIIGQRIREVESEIKKKKKRKYLENLDFEVKSEIDSPKPKSADDISPLASNTSEHDDGDINHCKKRKKQKHYKINKHSPSETDTSPEISKHKKNRHKIMELEESETTPKKRHKHKENETSNQDENPKVIKKKKHDAQLSLDLGQEAKKRKKHKLRHLLNDLEETPRKKKKKHRNASEENSELSEDLIEMSQQDDKTDMCLPHETEPTFSRCSSASSVHIKDIQLENQDDSMSEDYENIETNVKCKRKYKEEKIYNYNTVDTMKRILSKSEYTLRLEEKKEVLRKRRCSLLIEGMGYSKHGKEASKSQYLKAEKKISQGRSLEDILDEVKDQIELRSESFKSLKDIKFDIPWSVPALHQIETRVANRPNAVQKESMNKLQVEIKTGIYTKAEDAQIQRNWEYFCKLHKLPLDPTPFVQFSTPSGDLLIPTEERIKFARFLAHGLDNRMLCSVYRRFKRLYMKTNRNNGRFTAKEDKVILDFMKVSTSRTPHADLAKILNRDKLSIEKRCESLVAAMKRKFTPMEWGRSEIQTFLTHMFDVLELQDLEELKDRHITPEEWKEISVRMNISSKALRQAWLCNIYPKVFIEVSKLNTAEVKKYLIKVMYKRGDDDSRAINWSEVSERVQKRYQGLTGTKLNRMMKHLINYHVPPKMSEDFRESVKFLHNVVLENPQAFTSRLIKRVRVLDKREEEINQTF